MKKIISVILAIILFFGFSGGQFNHVYADQLVYITGGANFTSATLLTDQSSHLTLIPTEDWSMGWELWHNDYPYFKFIPTESGEYTLTVTGYGESGSSTFGFQVSDNDGNSYLDNDSTNMNYDSSNQRKITVQAGIAYYINIDISTKETTYYEVGFDKPLQSKEGEDQTSVLTIDPIDDITVNSLEANLPRATVRDENGDLVTGKTLKYTSEELSEYGARISSSDRYIELGSSTPNGTYTVTVSLADDSAKPITFDLILSKPYIALNPESVDLVKGKDTDFFVEFPAVAVYDSEGNLMADVVCEIIGGDFEALGAYIIEEDDDEGDGEEAGFQLSKEIPLGTYRLFYGLRSERMMELSDSKRMPDLISEYKIIVRNPKISYVAGTGGSITGETSQTVEPGANGTAVTAVANDGYTFSQWSDGVITASRADENVIRDISVIAQFIATVSSSGGRSGGGSHSNTTIPSSQKSVTVIVNGQRQDAGKETTITEDGRSTVTVEVDNKVIENKIDEAIKSNTMNNDNLFQVPIEDTKSDTAKVGMTGDIVKKLEENNFDVSVKRDNVEYVIPAEEFTISKVAENLGLEEEKLADIKVEVKITKLDEKVVEKYNEVAKANGAELVFPPVEFEIVAKTTKTDGTTKEQSINKFSNYVERVMEIPTGVDPSKITTGIVFNSDGTYSHVPTTLYQKDGKWYASLNSLTNSNYSVVWNTIIVKSVENHWAKDAVNDMASRLVIFNVDTFEPNKAITRADFAEYIVRALGIYRQGTYENKFKDISATGDRTLAILIANKYGIVTGYSDGTFKGDNQITREEAMTMYQRAMKITKLTQSDASRYQNYTDYTKVSGWAANNVKEVLGAHVFNGTTATTISPKLSLSYAEAAQAIKNLLVESKLINK
ncbi:S-layer homology domain-containing protein [Anaerovorax odorimutans]|uniref:S-layer homology domain-containing protein n=1 Tax=Anaerovorax odorimutans TaxID=109327 RepID=UPI0003FEB9EF|nr:S-layer homology domain-containing protein [Anaerovorax odorimutans]